jgi:hypothetical protein
VLVFAIDHRAARQHQTRNSQIGRGLQDMIPAQHEIAKGHFPGRPNIDRQAAKVNHRIGARENVVDLRPILEIDLPVARFFNSARFQIQTEHLESRLRECPQDRRAGAALCSRDYYFSHG